MTDSAADRTADAATLDQLIARLERAAEQLRSGDLSADAAAGLVEDCAAVELGGGLRGEREQLPGQDSLL